MKSSKLTVLGLGLLLLSFFLSCAEKTIRTGQQPFEGQVLSNFQATSRWQKWIAKDDLIAQVVNFDDNSSLLRICRGDGKICKAPWPVVFIHGAEASKFDASDLTAIKDAKKTLSRELDLPKDQLLSGPFVLNPSSEHPIEETNLIKFYGAIVQAQRSDLMSMVSSDVVIEVQARGERTRGLISNYFKLLGLRHKFSEPHFDLLSYHRSGNKVFVQGRVKELGACKQASGCADIFTADLLTFSPDGLVAKIEVFHLDM